MRKLLIWISIILPTFLPISVLAQSTASSESLAELYTKQKSAISNILRLERSVTKLEQELNKLKDRTKSHLGSDYYSKTISALGRASKGKATASDKEHLDVYVISHDTSSAALAELNDVRVEQENAKKELLELDIASKKLEDERKTLLSTELELENIRSKTDKSISSIDQENEFRLWISAAFTLLVALVITGFFLIVLKKENISADIFSGEKGIQFITLFLIIIAVILFGIMGILESRELSALLGALSGYILGRTSTNKTSQKEAA